MEMKIIVVIATAVVVIAAGAGVLVWTSTGGEASCDEQGLIEAIEAGIGAAERDGRSQVSLDMPDACDDDDLGAALPAVSRTWHVMPGGVLMREPTHSEPG